ncbi:MAG: response regulator transcription factor [Vampirovibrionales bacterium]|nr:response regulator transcription factor [Vampirovibrionales bacterium]
MNKPEMPIKILIAEDHEFTRTGLAYSFQAHPQYLIVGEAENGLEALAEVEARRPDIVLMDIGMPEMDGINATQKIKAQFPDVKVIMLTSRQFSEEIYASLAAGADAYCMKDITTDKLLQVIEVVMEGAMWLDPAVARAVVNALPHMQSGQAIVSGRVSEDRPLERYQQVPQSAHQFGQHRGPAYNTDLTEREVEVLQSIAAGRSNKDIAEHLSISVNTVKSHVRNLIQKLSVDDRTQAAVKALQEGLI